MKSGNKIIKVMVMSLVALLAVSLILGGCAKPAPAPTPAPAPAPKPAPAPAPEQIKWTAQCTYPGAGGKCCHIWADWAEEVSGGQLEVDRHAGGAIVPTSELFEAVSKGVVDYCNTWGGYNTGYVPEANIEIGLPFAWKNAFEVWDAFYERGIYDIIHEAYLAHNIYWLPTNVDVPYYFLGTTFPCNKLDDLKGKKIRASGVCAKWIEAAGGKPTTVPAPEQYMALKLGTIDGSWTSLGTGIADFKMHEVWKYYIVEPEVMTVVSCHMFNLDSWNALPADLRKTLERDSRYIMAGMSLWYRQSEVYTCAKATEYGLELVRWSPEDCKRAMEIAVPLWDEAAKLSPKCAKMVEIIKQQLKDAGRVD